MLLAFARVHRRRSGPLFIEFALPLLALNFSACQGERLKDTLVAEFGLVVWLLACLGGSCVRVRRRLVLLSHAVLKNTLATLPHQRAEPATSARQQDKAVYNTFLVIYWHPVTLREPGVHGEMTLVER